MNASRTIRHPETRCKAAFGPDLALAALLACLAVPALARVGEWQVGTWSGGFTAAETNLIAGLAPSFSSGIRNTYGGKNVALLTNGAAVPKVQAATQCLCNNAVLTYTLPQASNIEEVRIYSTWSDKGRDKLSVASIAVEDITGATYEISPGPTNHESTTFCNFAILASPDGSLAKAATSITIRFGAQENSEAGYAEIEVVGCGIAGTLLIQGSPSDIGEVSPSYGLVADIAPGEAITCTAPAAWTNAAGDTVALCAGYQIYTNGFLRMEGSGNQAVFDNTAPKDGTRLVWKWNAMYRVTSAAGAGGTVSPATQWVAHGGTATLTATPDGTHCFYRWTGDAPAGGSATSPTIQFAVKAPATLTANFAPVFYVSATGSDENDGTSWNTAFATVEHALAADDADGATIRVGAGTYALSSVLTLDHAVTVEGAGTSFADVTLDAGGARRVAVLSHAEARLRNLTLANGYDGTTAGGGCVRIAGGGTVENCRATGGNILRLGAGAGIYNDGGTIRDCVIDNNTAKGNIYSGLGLYQKGAGALAERCVITNNHQANLHTLDAHYPSLGVRLDGGVVRNCLIARNWGGAENEGPVYAGGASTGAALGVFVNGGTLANCAVVGNTYASGGRGRQIAGVFFRAGAVVNCLIRDNADYGGYPCDTRGSGSYRNCCVSDIGSVAGTGNIAPAFAGYALDGGVFRLLPGSPCINAGIADASVADAADDLYGAPRVASGAIDIGPVEHAAPASLGCGFDISAVCGFAPLATTFTAVVESGTAASYSWRVTDGTEGGTFTGGGATFSAALPAGRYDVSLTVGDGQGRTATHAVAGAVVVLPATVFVDASSAAPAFPYATPETAARSLADLQDHLADGLVIRVAPGVYPIGRTFVLHRAVRVIGADRETTILQGSGSVRLLHVEAADALVAGVTLSGGHCPAGNLNGTPTLGAMGGAILLEGAGMLSNCVVTAATGARGAMGTGAYVYNATVADTVFRNITRGQDIVFGAAMVLDGADALATHCVVTNVTTSASAHGKWQHTSAAVDVTAGEVRNTLIANCTFRYTADEPGHKHPVALLLRGGGARATSCTLADNRIPNRNGTPGVTALSGSLVRNCLIVGNADVNGEYNWFNEGATWDHNCTTPVDGLTAVAGNALAAAFPFAEGGWTPAVGSFAIGGGVAESWMAGAKDLAGRDRLRAGQADIGAYAYVPPSFSCPVAAGATSGFDALDATLTASPEGEAAQLAGLVYYWDFENDGVTDASGPGLSSVRHTYATFGETTTRLSVTNAHGVGTTSFITFRVQPSVIYVASGNPSAAAPYATWETAAAMPAEALAYAFDGSRVLVSNGTYRLPAPIVIERAITFESVGGRDVTTLHADGNFRAVSLRNAGLVFRGFTVTNGYGGDTGGGIHILSGTAERCRVSGGRGPYRFVRGFCVHNEGGTIRDSEIGWCEPVETNVTSSSAILYGVGLYMSGENAVAERCVIRENTGNNTHKSSTHSFGVGVMMTGGLLRSCLVTKNMQRNGREGGEKAFAAGIYLSGGKVVNCTVAGNRAEGGSAGIYAAGGQVVNTLLADNLTPAGAVANAAGPGVFAYCRADAADGLAGTGVTTAEPLFAGEGDYRLQPASPLARAGLYDPALLSGATDLAGRPLADSRNRVPIGCYATPSAATMIILH